MSKIRPPRLGRGLSSLLNQPVAIDPPPAPQPAPTAAVTPPARPSAAPAAASSAVSMGSGAPATALAAPADEALEVRTLDPIGTQGEPAIDATTSAAAPVTIQIPLSTAPAAGSSLRGSRSGKASAQIGGEPSVSESADTTAPAAAHFTLDLPTLDLADAIHRLPLDAIEPNPHQPRQTIEPAALQHLADSIRQDGVIQPIVVRPGPAAGRYTLVAGERRWRAARLAGLERIPALVRTLSDRDLAQWALVENLQREDLNPIERAQAFQHLIDRFNMSHEQVAEQVGVERSTISNSLRLLNLCDNVQGWVIEGRLTAGHARALAGVADLQRQMLLAQRVIREDWSVRKLEALLRQEAQAAAAAPGANPPTSARANHLADLEQQIARQLGTKVRLRPGKKKGTGTLVIDFYSIEQFDSLMTRLNVSTE